MKQKLQNKRWGKELFLIILLCYQVALVKQWPVQWQRTVMSLFASWLWLRSRAVGNHRSFWTCLESAPIMLPELWRKFWNSRQPPLRLAHMSTPSDQRHSIMLDTEFLKYIVLRVVSFQDYRTKVEAADFKLCTVVEKRNNLSCSSASSSCSHFLWSCCSHLFAFSKMLHI